jgi:hypothetical protein
VIGRGLEAESGVILGMLKGQDSLAELLAGMGAASESQLSRSVSSTCRNIHSKSETFALNQAYSTIFEPDLGAVSLWKANPIFCLLMG